MLEIFKQKNSNKYVKNTLDSLSIEDLYKNNTTNMPIFLNKILSDFSLPEQINEKNEDKKKIISDNKINDLYENNNSNNINDMNEKLMNQKFRMFSSSSLQNLEQAYNPSSMLYDRLNRQQNNNIDNNNKYRFQILGSTSFSNSMNKIPSLNNISLPPSGISQRNILYINNINKQPNNNNNLISINTDICTKKTLLSPPPSISNYNLPILNKLNGPPLLSSIGDKNISNKNFTFSTENNILQNNEINNSTLNVFNKKRKRDIKNNKLVFISGDNKKEQKEKLRKKERKKIKMNEKPKENNNENMKKYDENSEKNIKPRGSKFRGVSRNGNQWQVLIMVNKKKRYVGSYSKEEDAARAYDKVALQNHGSKAKTNFDYTKKEVEDILASPQLLKLN